jgi:hypothetical protein
MLVKSTRTEFRMLMSLLVLGLALMALTGCQGAAARTAAAVVSPGQEPTTPSITFEPIMPKTGI